MMIAWRVLFLTSLIFAMQLGQGVAGIGPSVSSISGQVVTETGTPIKHARVSLIGQTNEVRQLTATDGDGQFFFSGIPSGRYLLQAVKPPYLPAFYGAKRINRPGTPIAVSNGSGLSGLSIHLTMASAVEGRVTDRWGMPLTGASVAALRLGINPVTGERSATETSSVVTDDRGVYRAYGLLPGEYLIAVRPPSAATLGAIDSETRQLKVGEVDQVLQNARQGPSSQAVLPGTSVVFAPIYYPGTSDSGSSTIVTLEAAQERQGVDISFLSLPSRRIFGTVTAPATIAPASVEITVTLSSPDSAIPKFVFYKSIRADADGHYVVSGVPPGSYVVRARTGLGTTGRATAAARADAIFWANQTTVIRDQDQEVTLALQPAVRITGRVQVLSRVPPTPKDFTSMRIGLRPVGEGGSAGYQPFGQVSENGSFVIDGVVPGKFRFMPLVSSRPNLLLYSVRLGEKDLLEFPIEVQRPLDGVTVSFTDNPSEVAGSLFDQTGRPASDYFIVFFSTDRTYWTPLSRRILSVRPGTDGSYLARNLPAGDYFAAVVTDLVPEDLVNPQFLDGLALLSVKINVVEASRTVQSFRLSRK